MGIDGAGAGRHVVLAQHGGERRAFAATEGLLRSAGGQADAQAQAHARKGRCAFASGAAFRSGCVVVLALAAGCSAVGPEYERPPVPVPERWSPGAEAAASEAPQSPPVAAPFDDRWWRVFGDPMLDRLVDEAAAQNLDLRTAALRIAAARVQRDVVAADRWPSLGANAVAGRERMSENGIGTTFGGSSSAATGSTPTPGTGAAASTEPSLYANLFQLGFDATWELDLWGKTRRSIEAADANARSAEAQRSDAAVSLAAEVARTYLSLRGAQRRQAIVQADVAARQQLLALTESRRAAGLAPLDDVIAQRSQLSSLSADLPQVAVQISQATNRLALLLAEPPGALQERLAVPAGTAPPAGALPPATPVGLPGDLLRRRPDVRRSEADLQSASAQLGVATAGLFPSVELGVAAGLQATGAGSLFEWASRFFVGGAQVTLPLYQGGRLRAQVKIADLQLQQAVLGYREAVLSAYHDAENALVAYAEEQRRTVSYQQQLADAFRSRDLAADRYAAGLAPFIDVLDAERTAHQADLALNDSFVASATDLVALYKALGGGWTAIESSR